jgi:hypothetical protein
MKDIINVIRHIQNIEISLILIINNNNYYNNNNNNKVKMVIYIVEIQKEMTNSMIFIVI